MFKYQKIHIELGGFPQKKKNGATKVPTDDATGLQPIIAGAGFVTNHGRIKTSLSFQLVINMKRVD